MPTLFLGAVAFLLTFFAGKTGTSWLQWLLYGACAGLFLFGFLIPVVRYLTAWTDITTSRVVVRSGIWGQHYRSVSIATIGEIKRLPGGPIVISAHNEEHLELRGLPKPRLITQELLKLMHTAGSVMPFAAEDASIHQITR